MARKTVHITVCDGCGKDVEPRKGAVMRANPSDGRVNAKQADLCDDCYGKLPGVTVKRRGRRPVAA